MRTIKFRAWCTLDNTMVKPMTLQEMIYSNKSTASLKQLNEHFIFEQFTGLTDINGKEIYEGDIVRIDEYGQVWSVEYDASEAHFIVYNQVNSDRDIQADYGNDDLHSFQDKVVSPVKVVVCEGFEFYLEVVGNIHDNPELIKRNEEQK